MQRVMTTLAVLALAGTASAQTINANAPGNARFVYNAGAVPTTAPVGTLGGGSSNLNTNVAAGDQLFENWWHYRVEGADTREVRYNAAANPFVAAGNTMSGTFNFANFRSELSYVLTDGDGAGTQQAHLLMSNKVTNTTASAQTINIYNYADYDVNGELTDTYSYNALEQRLEISDAAPTVSTAYFKGFGATAYQAAIFTTTSGAQVRGALADADVDNLNNTVTGSPGDMTGAFQWTFTLNPGEMFTMFSVLSVNQVPVIPTPGALALVGLAGVAGLRRRR